MASSRLGVELYDLRQDQKDGFQQVTQRFQLTSIFVCIYIIEGVVGNRGCKLGINKGVVVWLNIDLVQRRDLQPLGFLRGLA